LSLEGENGWLGKPVQNQVQQFGGFIKQLFENGYMSGTVAKRLLSKLEGLRLLCLLRHQFLALTLIPQKMESRGLQLGARHYETKPSGKLSEATPTSKFLGSFDLGSNSKKELKLIGVRFSNGNSHVPR
jgi:hypothetical protein